ncbi:response regulator transcription factor [Corynebacterium sp. HMSC04H06]|uniref:response regulator transcription factor n=1 Tax=Corynebacterium sp. HMSC04H06 TaxID=1581050 RepID=UPI0008A496AE|nr:response regulator transcription factor [Corynebacterium sp. HMSC04H06]OFS19477.1 DNA-binding response regulator [Corynebacterium sp. HMSC04H06]
MTTPIRVLLADDQALLVQALATILNSAPDIEVVATAGNGQEAIEAASAHRCDVAVLDIRMPGTDGIAATRQLLAQPDPPKVIMLTTFDEPALVADAIAAEAQGFLLKDADPGVLIDAVRTVAAGESVLASKVTGPVLESYRRGLSARDRLSPEQLQGLSLVTRREREVLHLIGQGATNPELARELVLAETTIKTHVSSLLSKLHCRDRVALALLARDLDI